MPRLHPILLLLLGALALAGCSRGAPRYGTADATPIPTAPAAQPLATDAPAPQAEPTSAPEPAGPLITVDAAAEARPIDPRLYGTNAPAWLNPSNLQRDEIRTLTQALGSPVLRIPGGSWSNSYNWLACEQGDGDSCYWTWAARPTDFLTFVRATGQEAMWTVSINGTSKEAAALVAFFNGSVDDSTPIGIDVRGRDWKTVGDWARLRAEHGNPDPLPIKLWEVGNEVYGGKAEGGGPECAPWGWEDVWTCDGTEYMRGKSDGAVRYEGYLEFRAAMKAVDPTIMVGAVGVPYPGDWSNWGNEVIREGGENLDFYVIHYYAFDQQPQDAQAALAAPQQVWKGIMEANNAAFDTLAGGRRPPVAVTEYNLVAFHDLDNEQLMTRAVNALFLADMIGQMAEHGVTMANQWDLANGRANNGTDYGLIDVDSGWRAPQYYAMVLWSRFADSILPVESSLPADTTLSAYAGRSADGSLSLMVINKTGDPIVAQVRLNGASGPFKVTAESLAADALDQTDVSFNGISSPAADLADAPAQDFGIVDVPIDYSFAPYSVTLLRLTPAS